MSERKKGARFPPNALAIETPRKRPAANSNPQVRTVQVPESREDTSMSNTQGWIAIAELGVLVVVALLRG